jgi:hypothetical protein
MDAGEKGDSEMLCVSWLALYPAGLFKDQLSIIINGSLASCCFCVHVAMYKPEASDQPTKHKRAHNSKQYSPLALISSAPSCTQNIIGLSGLGQGKAGVPPRLSPAPAPFCSVPS